MDSFIGIGRAAFAFVLSELVLLLLLLLVVVAVLLLELELILTGGGFSTSWCSCCCCCSNRVLTSQLEGNGNVVVRCRPNGLLGLVGGECGGDDPLDSVQR